MTYAAKPSSREISGARTISSPPTSDSGQVVVKELQHSSDHPRAIAIGSHELGIGTLNSALTKALHDPD